MSTKEFNSFKENQEKTISINTFLLTTKFTELRLIEHNQIFEQVFSVI
jgi:hypothetical protein